jgi:hypothetical protein
MKSILLPGLIIIVILSGCRYPDRWITGIYITKNDDTLRVKNNRSFRVELTEPDTAGLKQLKFTSGRWHQERGKLYLTVATKSMGDYWQCVPMKIGIKTLKRPIECTENGPKSLVFKKIRLKKVKKVTKKRWFRRKKTEEAPEE